MSSSESTAFDAIIVGAGQAGPPLAGRLTEAGQTVAVPSGGAKPVPGPQQGGAAGGQVAAGADEAVADLGVVAQGALKPGDHVAIAAGARTGAGA